MLPELLCILGIKGIDKALNTQTGKNNADEWGMYRDGNGNYRLKQNGRKVVDTYDENGDYIIKYVNDGTTAINITKIEAKKREDEAISQGKRFYLRQKQNGWRGQLGVRQIWGERYCEVGKPYIYYVKRQVDYTLENGRGYFGEFYMDMKCNLVCPTEETVEKDKQIFDGSNEIYGLLAEDNTELYNMIINEWKSYIASPYVDVKYNTLHKLGRTTKRDYKVYTDKIDRWR